MVDANKDISSFRNLTAVNLTGTLLTAAQPNTTSIGTLSSLNVSGGLTASTLTGTLSTAAQHNITLLGTLTTGLQTTITNNTTSFASYARWTNSLTTPMNCVLEVSNIAPRFGAISQHTFRIYSGNAIAMWMDVSQNVRIGTVAPSGTYKLEVDGSINASAININGVAVAFRLI